MALCKYYAISYKRHEHLRISLSAGVLEPVLMGTRDSCIHTNSKAKK